MDANRSFYPRPAGVVCVYVWSVYRCMCTKCVYVYGMYRCIMWRVYVCGVYVCIFVYVCMTSRENRQMYVGLVWG